MLQSLLSALLPVPARAALQLLAPLPPPLHDISVLAINVMSPLALALKRGVKPRTIWASAGAASAAEIAIASATAAIVATTAARTGWRLTGGLPRARRRPRTGSRRTWRAPLAPR